MRKRLPVHFRFARAALTCGKELLAAPYGARDRARVCRGAGSPLIDHKIERRR
jgi:hypothetical protein